MLKAIKTSRESIYIFGLILLVTGIPLSNVLMSIAQIILLTNWLFDKNILNKIKLFYKNKAIFVFSLIFILHIWGLFFTTDFDYALKDLRTKLPLIALPVIISSSFPISYKNFKIILIFYVLSVLFGSIVSSIVYFCSEIDDVRNISVFISHIRFSLNICLSICILFYFLYIKNEFNYKQRIIATLILLWLIVFVFILQSLTGIFILLFLIIFYAVFLLLSHRQIKTKIFVSITILLFLTSVFLIVSGYYKDYFYADKISLQHLDKKTKDGNPYEHDLNQLIIENGNYIGLYICNEELDKAWALKSKLNIDSFDRKKQHLRSTLIRFLNSKGYRKDAEGVAKLTNPEIKAIENGCANYVYLNGFSLKSRIYKIFFEFSNFTITGAISGYSVVQRVELWKAAALIIKDNFFFGVGTGDMVNAYRNQLIKMNSELKNQSLRSHNQYLSIFSAFGIIGFILFLIFFLYPLFIDKLYKNFLFLSFFIIAALSMLNEDTIESQSGVTFFAFFYVFFCVFNSKSKLID